MARAKEQTSPWLQGPASDLLLGCGLLYAGVFAYLSLISADAMLSGSTWLAAGVILLTGVPHYGATLLRVIEHPQARARYKRWTIWSGLIVWGIFALGLYQQYVGSLLLTTYLCWSPWHYTLQNYGIALMFLRRRGIDIDQRARRLLYASFILSFALTMIVLHGQAAGGIYVPVSFAGSAFSFISLGIPLDAQAALFTLTLCAYLIVVASVLIPLLRAHSVRALIPVLAVVFAQALWFSVPAAFRFYGLGQGIASLSVSSSAQAFMWVGVAHSIQYLWITDYFAARSAPGHNHARYFVRAVLAGSIIWIAPMILFGPNLLGPLPYDAGLLALAASAVNIQHFVLDGVIWKLRDEKIASVLVRSETREDAAPQPAWARRAFVGVGALCFVIYAGNIYEREFGMARALIAGDFARYEQAERRLGWLGLAGYKGRSNAALVYENKGDYGRAIAELEESLRRWESPDSWSRLCYYYQRARRSAQSRLPCTRAFETGRTPDAALQLALVLSVYPEDPARDPARAVVLAEDAVRQVGERDPFALNVLGITYAATGRFEDATRAASNALYAAQSLGESELARKIETLLAGYQRGEPYLPTN